jgi:putative flippase GtrA
MSPSETSPAPGILRRLGNEMAKFGVVGIVGVVIQLVIFRILLEFMPGASVRANVIATLVAIGTNYIGYRYWVYRDADPTTRSREITLFLIFSGIGLVIQNAVLYALTYGLDMHGKSVALVFTLIGIGVATLFRFWAYRTFVFTGASARDASGLAASGAVGDAAVGGGAAIQEAEEILARSTGRTTPPQAPAAGGSGRTPKRVGSHRA